VIDLTSATLTGTHNRHAPSLVLRLAGLADAVRHRLAVVYFCLAASTVIVLAWVMPPFQNPDELSHFQRIDQITHGTLIGQRFGRAYSGGSVDANIEQAYAPFALLPFHANRKVSAEMLLRAGKLPWSGERTLNQFPNTAIYPPFCYLPSIAAVAAGQLSGLSVVDTLRLTRLVNGLVAVSVAAAAIAVAGAAAPVLFAVLTLPMALGQMAAVSQDGLILALTGMAVALAARAVQDGRLGRGAFTGLCLCLALACSARPPYVFLALIIPALPGVPRRSRLIGTAAVVALVGGWSLLAATLTQVVIEQPDVFPNPAAQLARLLADPGRIAAIAGATLGRYLPFYAEQFVGTLGWFDVLLPRWVHLCAALGLGLGLVAVATGRTAAPRSDGAAAPAAPHIQLSGGQLPGGQLPNGRLQGVRLAAAGGILLAAGAIFGIQYLTWTDVGGPVVLGVQGRYFIPLALACALIALPVRTGRHAGWTGLPLRSAALVIAVLPFLFVPTMIKQITERYYLQPERLSVRIADHVDGPLAQAGSIDLISMESTPDGEPARMVVLGWAKLSVDDPTHSLTVVSPSRIDTVSAVGVERPDVAAHFGDQALRWSGFSLTLTLEPPPAGQRPALCIVSDDAQLGRFLLPAGPGFETGEPPCAFPKR